MGLNKRHKLLFDKYLPLLCRLYALITFGFTLSLSVLNVTPYNERVSSVSTKYIRYVAASIVDTTIDDTSTFIRSKIDVRCHRLAIATVY